MAKSKAANGLNKTQMVVDALSTLGADAQPGDIQKYVHDTHGVELSKTMISSYKSNILKKQGKGVSTRRSSGAANSSGSVGLKDLTVLRELIDRVGASEVQEIVKVLTR